MIVQTKNHRCGSFPPLWRRTKGDFTRHSSESGNPVTRVMVYFGVDSTGRGYLDPDLHRDGFLGGREQKPHVSPFTKGKEDLTPLFAGYFAGEGSYS